MDVEIQANVSVIYISCVSEVRVAVFKPPVVFNFVALVWVSTPNIFMIGSQARAPGSYREQLGEPCLLGVSSDSAARDTYMASLFGL